jgi:circadian clock protein KaiB
LYINGDSELSLRARARLEQICREQLGGQCRLEIIDLAREPARALEDGVLVTPTLVSLEPPGKRLIGDLTRVDALAAALEIPMNGKCNGQSG